MNFKCKHCGQDYDVDDVSAGQVAECIDCGKEFIIEPKATVQPLVATAVGATIPAGGIDSREEWNVGDVILDLYEVRQVHEGGGMGLVYRVHHRSWNTDLAVKSPRSDFFHTEAQKEDFIRECETWINLGLHPHIVSCHYVRMLGGIPRVFAEYVEGGNLKEWIDNQKIYEGDEQEVIKRILDIAIQFAWGLHYAHDHSLIHQDVKPANVMMTPDGTAKVSDFGLAKARAAAAEVSTAPVAGMSMVVPGCGLMTPQYASPEQAAGEPLTRRTDIWSWAVSILEMFVGEVIWQSGTVAGETLEAGLEEGDTFFKVAPPEKLVSLMRKCFRVEPAERYETILLVATELVRIYEEIAGEVYPRIRPESISERADMLNNRAISLLDLGQDDRAESLLREALKEEPGNISAVFNLGLIHWRNGVHSDTDFLTSLQSSSEQSAESAAWSYLKAIVHLERGDLNSARREIEILSFVPRLSDDVSKLNSTIASLFSNRESSCLLKTFSIADEKIMCSAVSEDGTMCIAGGISGGVFLSRHPFDRIEKIRAEDQRGIKYLSFSRNSRLCFAIYGGKYLRIYELENKRIIKEKKLTDSIITNADFDKSTGSLVFSFLGTGADKANMAFAIAPDYEVKLIKLGKISSNVFTIFDGGKKIIAQHHRGELVCLNTGNMALVTLDNEGDVLISSVAVSSDMRYAAAGYDNQTIKIWGFEENMVVAILKSSAKVEAVEFVADSNILFSREHGGKVRAWDFKSGKCLCSLDETYVPESVSSGATGMFWSSVSVEGSMQIWRFMREFIFKAPFQIARPKSAIQVASHENEFKRIIGLAVAKYEEGNAEEASNLIHQALAIPGFERSPEALSILKQIACNRKKTGVLNLWSRELVKLKNSTFISVAISADGGTAAALSADGIPVLLSPDSDETHTYDEFSSGGFTKIAIAPDCKHLVCVNAMGLIKTIRMENINKITTKEFISKLYKISHLQFFPDGKRVAAADGSGSVRIFSFPDVRQLRFIETGSAIISMEISPDGEFICTSDRDNGILLWDASGGKLPLCRIYTGKDSVTRLSFSPGSGFVIAGDYAGMIHFCSLRQKRILHSWYGADSPACGLSFCPEGRFFAAAFEEGRVMLWEKTGKKSGDYEFECIQEIKTPPLREVGNSKYLDTMIFGYRQRGVGFAEVDWKLDFAGIPVNALAKDVPPHKKNLLSVLTDDASWTLRNLIFKTEFGKKIRKVAIVMIVLTVILPILWTGYEWMYRLTYVDNIKYRYEKYASVVESCNSTGGVGGSGKGNHYGEKAAMECVDYTDKLINESRTKALNILLADKNQKLKVFVLSRLTKASPEKETLVLKILKEHLYDDDPGNLICNTAAQGIFQKKGINALDDFIELMKAGKEKRKIASFYIGRIALDKEGVKLVEEESSRINRYVDDSDPSVVANIYAALFFAGKEPDRDTAFLTDLAKKIKSCNSYEMIVQFERMLKRKNKAGPVELPLQGQPWTSPGSGMKFVYVAPGSFQMGTNYGESKEKPVHTVTISKGYWLGKFEVTQDEYMLIMGNNPSLFRGANRPVEQVNANEATIFCKKMTEWERVAGRLPSGYEYRLPTEAEWEFAAIGGNATHGYEYSGSDDPKSVAWHDGNSAAMTHDVGTKSSNELGINDMSGNVWEWCGDQYSTYSNNSEMDPVGKPSRYQSSQSFAHRGGGWGGSTWYCQTSVRYFNGPGKTGPDLGFRVALAPVLTLNDTNNLIKSLEGKKSQPAVVGPLPGKNWTAPVFGMKFIYIAPGNFQTGSINDESKEELVHHVEISKEYWIGKFEVTINEYRGIMGYECPGLYYSSSISKENAILKDKLSFCKKITLRERAAGRLPSRYEYRLPTASELDYAARGGLPVRDDLPDSKVRIFGASPAVMRGGLPVRDDLPDCKYIRKFRLVVAEIYKSKPQTNLEDIEETEQSSIIAVKPAIQQHPEVKPGLLPGIQTAPAVVPPPVSPPPVPFLVSRDVETIRARLIADYDRKFPLWTVGEMVKLFSGGIAVNGKITEIGTTYVVIDEQEMRHKVAFSDIDVNSRLRIDQNFRAERIESEVKPVPAKMSVTQQVPATIPAPPPVPVKMVMTRLPAKRNTADLEMYQQKVNEAKASLETLKKQCAQAKINYNIACAKKNYGGKDDKYSFGFQKTNRVKNEPAIQTDIDDTKKLYDDLTSRIEKANNDIQYYNQRIDALK